MNSRAVLCIPLGERLSPGNLTAFGQLTPLLDGLDKIYNADHVLKQIVSRLEAISFDPTQDYIVWSGPGVCLAYFTIAVAHYMAAHYPDDTGYTALAFNSKEREYQRISIPL